MDRVVVVAVINLILVTAYFAFSGLSGVLSFGHMAFATIGGYAAGLAAMPGGQKASLLPGLPETIKEFEAGPLIAVLIGGLVAALFGAIVSLPLSRISGLAAGLASAAILLAVHDLARNWDAVTRGSRGLSPLPSSTTLYSALVWLLVTIGAIAMYQRSRWGTRLRATRADRVAAEAVGISYRSERAIALVVSAFFTGIGGALFVLLLGAVTPDVFFLNYTFLVIAMAVVGGIDSLVGSIAGGVLVTVAAELLRQVEQGSLFGLVTIPSRPGLANVGLGILLLAVLIWRPKGIARDLDRLWMKSAATATSENRRDPSSKAVALGGKIDKKEGSNIGT